MKKFIASLLSLVLLVPVLCFAALPAAAALPVAVPTGSTILVNGVNTAFQAYLIGSNNYFKLRDVAMVLNGTDKHFALEYDGVRNAVIMTSGQEYTPIGEELTFAGETGRVYADPSAQKVFLDGKQHDFKAYVIGGCNYVKLRDVATVLNFHVGWDGAADTITVDTSHEYNVGYLNPDIDYAKQEKYTIKYITQGYSGSFEQLNRAFEKWAVRLNCNYKAFYCNDSNDEIITVIEKFAAEGVDGMLIDAFPSNYGRVSEVLGELGMPWMGCAVAPYSYSYAGREALLHPAVEMDNTAVGEMMASWAIDYAGKTWPGAKADNTGMIALDYAIVSDLHQRVAGAQSVWDAAYPDENLFIANDPAHQMTQAVGYSMTKTIMDDNPQIEYWLVCACVDNYAEGAVRAATEKGLQTVTAVISCATPESGGLSNRGYAVGSNLIYDWDHAVDTCWKATVYTSAALDAEPMMCGLYEMMSGRALPEELFFGWINKKAGNKYATMKTPVFVLTEENYKEYLEWVDAYTGLNQFSYPYKGTQFELRSIPPLSYYG
jgi:ABC-type sugar transport system substrate-binding protein